MQGKVGCLCYKIYTPPRAKGIRGSFCLALNSQCAAVGHVHDLFCRVKPDNGLIAVHVKLGCRTVLRALHCGLGCTDGCATSGSYGLSHSSYDGHGRIPVYIHIPPALYAEHTGVKGHTNGNGSANSGCGREWGGSPASDGESIHVKLRSACSLQTRRRCRRGSICLHYSMLLLGVPPVARCWTRPGTDMIW